MNYIDALALMVYECGNPDEPMDDAEWHLYRTYAVLVLAKGEETTAEDVHDAWSAWALEHRSFSKNIIPFDQLTPDVQAMDDEYVAAIHSVRRRVFP